MNRLLINPIAGHGFAKRNVDTVKEILKSHGVEFDVVTSEYAGHAVELARESARRGDETLFLLGGDGSIIEVSRGLYGSDTALATIPCGTGNDFRKTLNVPTDVTEAVKYVLSREPRKVDCAFIKDCSDAENAETLFMNESGTGFDVAALEYSVLSKKFLRGLSAYMYGVLRAIISYKAKPVTITLDDGKSFTRKITMLAIANGQWMGGGFKIAPEADLYDGLFDIIIIGELSRMGILKALPKIMDGRVMQLPIAEHFRCREIHIKGENISFNIDGELKRISEAHYRLEKDGVWVRA
ncbi:MAG: diacylglycerol kinase family lipid kinase [Oscillospiraceae bacterium]|jgi:YegS/Rv2252/BmrU family lipid kinase|nr:diacylglycerol kinase family lipid kinase [Oscillospiraceae bacterium]